MWHYICERFDFFVAQQQQQRKREKKKETRNNKSSFSIIFSPMYLNQIKKKVLSVNKNTPTNLCLKSRPLLVLALGDSVEE